MADEEMTETEDYNKSSDPTLHHATHEDGGADQIDALGLIFPSCFRSYISATQTIPTSVTTKIDLDTESFDKGNDYSIANQRFTAPQDGTYFFSLTALIGSPGDTKQFRARIYKNDAIITNSIYASPGVSYLSALAFLLVELSENDYIDFRCYHDQGYDRTLSPQQYDTFAFGFLIY